MLRIPGIIFVCLACSIPMAAQVPSLQAFPSTAEKAPLLPAALPDLLDPYLDFSSNPCSGDGCSAIANASNTNTINQTAPEGQPRADGCEEGKNADRQCSETPPVVPTGGGLSSGTGVGIQPVGAPVIKPEDFLSSKTGTKKTEVAAAGIKWDKVFLESLFFLGIEHGFRLLDPKQPYPRQALRGPFFKDWFDTVGTLAGWGDGDPFLINYIGHPVQGAVSGRILLQNDPHSKYLEAGYNREYGKSVLKAFGFALFYGLQFELGPISEASIGNSQPSACCHHPTSYVDLVITPTVGMGWLAGEDLADRYFMGYLERRTKNRPLIIAARTFSNPSRSMANILRIKWPWYRDNRE
jgi:hypothetical protein